jgi:hypothetical protein
VRIQIGSIHQTTINGFSISSAVVLERRFAKVSGKRAVGNPSCGLFELKLVKNLLFK